MSDRQAPAAKSPAYQRFVASMALDMDAWRDGTGYDLGALKELTPTERADVERLLVTRAQEGWRDVEALETLKGLGSAAAGDALRTALGGGDVTGQLRAAKALHDAGALDDVGEEVARLLKSAASMNGLDRALAMAEEHPTPAVRKALLWAARHHPDATAAVHCAALLYYQAGLAAEAFDWDHRPFFLGFGEPEPERAAAFAELCEKIGADPKDAE